MELFEVVFSGNSIYEMLFFNIKAVLIHPTLHNLEEKNLVFFERWKYLSKSKHNIEIKGGNVFTSEEEKIYQEKAVYYPEFTKIIAISYAMPTSENGKIIRHLKRISSEDESIVIATFMDILYQLSSDGVKSNPQYFPTLCGHNIINNDIPLLIKRFIINRKKLEKKQLPFILKRCLSAKPWDSCVVDTINVWKFNGNEYNSLMLISDYLDLKRNIDLDTLDELSKKYWKTEKSEEALEYVSLQSATQTNLVIQLINELRQL